MLLSFYEIYESLRPLESYSLLLGYTGAVLTGFILGLLGGGGALLSIPVLVYFFHIPATTATGYSLFLVAITASTGAVQNIRKQMIDYPAALYYGIPSITTVYIFRRFIIHRLPEVFFSDSSFTITRDRFILYFLAVVMLGVAYRMIFTKDEEMKTDRVHHSHRLVLMVYAVLVGCFIGLVGAGGGFLMTPALIYFAGLDIRKAIGTSLLLVAVNSFIGFLGDISSSSQMDWRFLLIFSLFSVGGVLLGVYLHHRINTLRLKQGFGWMVLLIAIGIVAKETGLL